eukprot:TRINITY_DN106026_c0_g1_i1.p1 TRINITY_DN106026_c0_g1~~TRINITY_DN106026_c0_g1_i1.p1  ORF type:complete len:243 (+),score=40.59 TRINITY_DN106026_c0_g1_i1:52-729(+)
MASQCSEGCFQGLHGLCEPFLRRAALFRGDTLRSWLGRKEYWDAAYASGRYSEQYEWNQSCEVVWPYIERMLGNDRNSRVLHVGCGNSRVGKLLHDAGFMNVVNVDYSSVVIDMMRNKEPELCWLCADCAEPGSLGSVPYDYCIDKGAIDSLFEAGSESMRQQGHAMIQEIHRVLKPGGKYLIISNGGLGSEEMQAKFSSVVSESIEGYACDLYYKLIMVVLCTK